MQIFCLFIYLCIFIPWIWFFKSGHFSADVLGYVSFSSDVSVHVLPKKSWKIYLTGKNIVCYSVQLYFKYNS